MARVGGLVARRHSNECVVKRILEMPIEKFAVLKLTAWLGVKKYGGISIQ